MTWTDLQWDAFCGLIDEAWHGVFDDATASSWRVLLDGIDPDVATEGLRRLLLEGRQHRPSVSDVLAAARRDPSQPTFDEAFRLIFGRGGVLAARIARRGVDLDERRRLTDEAAADRANAMHPLVAAFVARQGIARLRALPLDDPTWGEKTRRDLGRAWDLHVEAFDGREVAVLASGGRRELGQLDPLAAIAAPTRPALEQTTGEEPTA